MFGLLIFEDFVYWKVGLTRSFADADYRLSCSDTVDVLVL